MSLFKNAQRNREEGSAAKGAGFTIIEVMIAMAIFTVLVTIGIGSVLSAIQQHHSTEDMSTVMNNLDFVMEDMARNIRLGTNIHCMAAGEAPLTFTSDTEAVPPQDCALSTDAHNSIVFNDQNGDHITYTISNGLGGTPSQIYKQEGSNAAQLISPPGVAINFAASGFTVQNSLPTSGGQPNVLIRLSGTISYKNVNSTFALETSVTLRNLNAS